MTTATALASGASGQSPRSLPTSAAALPENSAVRSAAALEAALPWEVFICRACGLLYDESKGDEDSGLAAGTRFADIERWLGPISAAIIAAIVVSYLWRLWRWKPQAE